MNHGAGAVAAAVRAWQPPSPSPSPEPYFPPDEDDDDAEAAANEAAAAEWADAEDLVRAKMLSMGGCEICTSTPVDASYKAAFAVDVCRSCKSADTTGSYSLVGCPGRSQGGGRGYRGTDLSLHWVRGTGRWAWVSCELPGPPRHRCGVPHPHTPPPHATNIPRPSPSHAHPTHGGHAQISKTNAKSEFLLTDGECDGACVRT